MNLHVPGPMPAAPKKVRELRNNPRFKLPARLVTDDADYAVTDFSRSGLGFVAPGALFEVGDSFPAELRFEFPDTRLGVEVLAEVRHFDQRTGAGGLSFSHRHPDGAGIIDFIINEHLAGRIMSTDGTLSRSDATRAAPRPVAAPRCFKHSGRGAM